MSSAHFAPALPATRGVTWLRAVCALCMALFVIGFAFLDEIVAALRTWDSSTAYNHCWLVLPVAGWLAWSRRDRLKAVRPEPWPAGTFGVAAAAIAWVAAERLGIMEGRQLAVIGMVWALVLSVFGWPFVKAMAAPLSYLVFLVPFGEFMVPFLQRWTAWFIVGGLNVLGIPNYHDDLVIEIPAGSFLVAEACAGLRFMVAALAFGALYAFTMFQSPWRRVAVMALAVIVPLVANGARALGIVLLGHYVGNAEAAAADHVVYGWVFFSVVILLLVLAGMPFREDRDRAPVILSAFPGSQRRVASLVSSAVLCSMLAVSAPAFAHILDSGEPPTTLPFQLSLPRECGGSSNEAEDRCENAVVTASLVVFSPRTTWAKVSAARRRLMVQSDEAVTFSIDTDGAVWHARQDRDEGTVVALASWLNGRPAGDGLRSRLAQALNSLFGGRGQPVIGVVTVQPEVSITNAAAQQRYRAWVRKLVEAGAASMTTEGLVLSR